MIKENHFDNEKGFTLVELLVALALAGIVSAAIYASFNSQERVYKAQQLVVEMQQNLKSAMLIAIKEVRMVNAYLGGSGLGWWDESAGGGSGDQVNLLGFRAYNDYENGTDAIDIAYADFTVATPVREEAENAANIKVQWTDGFVEDMLAIISDGKKSHLMKITHINPNTGNSGNPNASFVANRGNSATGINFPSGENWPSPYGAGAWIFQAKLISFRILHDDPEHPQLGISINYNPNDVPGDREYFPLAEDIEDLQLAYIFEDGDEAVEPDDDDGDTTNDYEDVATIRVSIVARTREPVRGFSGTAPPDLEDHDTADTPDAYQRRVLSEEVFVRNLHL